VVDADRTEPDHHALSDLEPAILHVDMDAFFAAVEVLDDPELAGKPVVVGGRGGRGVVASCTYEARAFGVRSAMPSARARQLCPAAIFVDGHYSRYAEVSEQLNEVLLSVTPLVEPIGLDEAFLDVTGARRLLGPPDVIAHALRAKVTEALSLDCSIGVGRSKMVAKLASRAAKPRATRSGKQPGPGVVVVLPADELPFLHGLAVEALWGVGPATARRLHDLGLRTVGELAALREETLVRRFGKAHGSHLAQLARGEDPSPVVPNRAAKSVGHEQTFGADIYEMDALQRHVLKMVDAVATHLRSNGLCGRTVTMKVRFADFSTITRSHTLSGPVDTTAALGAVAGALLEAVELHLGVRLLGVSVSGLQPSATSRQLAFDLGIPEADDALCAPAELAPNSAEAALRAAELQASWQEVTAAVDAIRQRFGKTAVGTAAMVGHDGLVIPGRREAPWGPSAASDGHDHT
jgi:DNA polymerase-4